MVHQLEFTYACYFQATRKIDMVVTAIGAVWLVT